MSTRKALTTVESLTIEEHAVWARKIWDRIDRDGSGELELQELNCDEFNTVFRSLIAPLTVGRGVAGYERSEMNLPQALAYCMKKADKNNDGVVSFPEFDSFLRFLRNERSPEHITNVSFALFAMNGNNCIDATEFKEIYRYFLGHQPLGPDFKGAWLSLDVEGKDQITKAEYARWLRKRAGPVFTQKPPRVIGSSNSSEAGGARHKASPKKIHRPAPGILPPRFEKTTTLDDFQAIWNDRWGQKDPSEQNLAFKGNQRMKSMFMRPQSLPELHRFYCQHTNFDKNRKKLISPEPFKQKLVLSADNQLSLTLPGAERHKPGGTMRNTSGDVVLWQENTPRALIRPKWEPGALLLRVPGPPPLFLVKGRGADDDP